MLTKSSIHGFLITNFSSVEMLGCFTWWFTHAHSCPSAELYDPATETWRFLARISVPRTYHSTALLLQDGRVFTGGGGLCGDCETNHFDAQIFSPPYLFNADGSAASRPTITVSVTTIANGNAFTVTGNVALSKIAIIRYGSSTHAVDTDQRRIELCGPGRPCTPTSGTTYSVTIPADPGVVPPGNWMVFGLNSAGVPSVSRTVRIGSTTTAARASQPGVVARSAEPAAGAASTADVPFVSYPLTPAAPPVPMRPGLQLD
jgi:hypothetical protein